MAEAKVNYDPKSKTLSVSGDGVGGGNKRNVINTKPGDTVVFTPGQNVSGVVGVTLESDKTRGLAFLPPGWSIARSVNARDFTVMTGVQTDETLRYVVRANAGDPPITMTLDPLWMQD